jgi:hypothetical protein
VHHSACFPEQGPFFVRQGDKFIDERGRCRVISTVSMGNDVEEPPAGLLFV